MTSSKLIGNILYLKFIGTCGLGAEGKVDSDYIVSKCMEKLKKNKSIYGIIYDFSEMNYQFGSGFVSLVLPSIITFKRKVLTSIISNSFSMPNWKSLIEFLGLDINFMGSIESLFQLDLENAVKSINFKFGSMDKSNVG